MKLTYRDDEGDFASWEKSILPCRDCGGNVEFRSWDSDDGGYTDHQHRCLKCKKVWWIDGDDG